MKLELDKYGIQMPAFSKIGGILANELSVDEAAGKISRVWFSYSVTEQVCVFCAHFPGHVCSACSGYSH